MFVSNGERFPDEATAPRPEVVAMPRVTVLMCVFNGERFLDEAIASVIGQDYDDFELLVVDDGSTDTTAAILERWASTDARVRVLRNEVPCGFARAANIGLDAVRGPYVARLDADDLCLPGRLEAEVEVLDRDPGTVLVSTNYEIIDAHGRSLAVENRALPSEVTAYLMHLGNALGGQSQVMFRRDAVRSIGGYREDLEVCIDHELWSRLVRVGRFVVLPILGMKYRLHGERVSARRLEQQRQSLRRVTLRSLTSLLGAEPTPDEMEAFASVWLEEGRWGVAAEAHRFLAKAFHRFCAGNTNRRHRALVRSATARRWILAAATFARRGNDREAAIHIGYAMRWHPLGAIRAAAILWQRFRTASRRMPTLVSYELPDESNSWIPLA